MEKHEERRPVASLREYLDQIRESFNIFRWIWREVTTPTSRKKLYSMFAGLFVGIILLTIHPWAIGLIFDGLINRKVDLIEWGIVLVGLCLLAERYSCQWQNSAREWVLGLHWGKLDERITELFFEKSIGQHIHEGTTLSVSNIDKGRWKLLDLQGMLLFDGVPAIAQLFMAFVFLCFLAWFAGFIMFAVILIYIGWSLYMNMRVNQVCTPIERDFRALNRRRVERWEKVERVKIAGKENEEIKGMSSRFDEVILCDRGFWLWFITQSNLRGLFNDFGVVAITAIGAWLVWSGHWQISLLYPLYAWTSKVSENIWRIGSIEHQISWNMPSVKSMIEALRITPAINDIPKALELDSGRTHRIEISQVSHTYPVENGKNVDSPPALVKVSFTIEPGEKVALLGPSGAGKTTLMRKILRFDDPTSGAIQVGGIDLRSIRQSSWRQGIGYIPQQAQVFDGTIRYNLTYGLSKQELAGIGDEDIWKLMRLLRIDFKERLTNGLDTLVGKNGIKLSGGQAQRLMIGAAAIKRPWFLVIDEATSSLDSVTERGVQEGLSEILKGSETSALIVAHRLSTVQHLCDKFVVLKEAGKVVNGESQVEAIAGSFRELYEKSPTFRNLADYQGLKIGS